MAGPEDFDFWIGNWVATWGTDGAQGRNVITKSHGGKAIEEHFDGSPGMELNGTSFSVYDQTNDRWLQTWVDDSGSYFALEGSVRFGEMVLICDRHNGPDAHVSYRMRFFDIGPDSFNWSWERTDDQGRSYKLLWQITYQREGASTTSPPEEH